MAFWLCLGKEEYIAGGGGGGGGFKQERENLFAKFRLKDWKEISVSKSGNTANTKNEISKKNCRRAIFFISVILFSHNCL